MIEKLRGILNELKQDEDNDVKYYSARALGSI